MRDQSTIKESERSPSETFNNSSMSDDHSSLTEVEAASPVEDDEYGLNYLWEIPPISFFNEGHHNINDFPEVDEEDFNSYGFQEDLILKE
jgi:hypothetical protein